MNRTTASPSFRSRIAIVATCALLAPWSTSVFAGAITSGQLVNIRVGDGTTTAGGGLNVTLDVYNVTYTGIVPTGVTFAQSIPLPIATSGAVPVSGNRYLAQSITAAAEGGLTLSGDGNYMALAGYNAIVGATLNGGSANTEDRVVGLLNLSTGVVDTSTSFTGWAGSTEGAAASRGAYTTNGTDAYLATSTGVRYGAAFTTIAGTGVRLGATNNNNARRDIVYNGQLYQTEAANSRFGVESVGTGVPTTTGNTFSLLNGFPTSGLSPYDFFFADPNTLYFADDRTSGNGGLEKWAFDGTKWNLVFNHPIAAHANVGLKGLTGYTDSSGNVVMFASTQGTGANFMMGLTDTLSNTVTGNVTENTLVDASVASTFNATGTVWNLRGLAIAPIAVPEPATLSLLALSCVAFVSRRSRSTK